MTVQDVYTQIEKAMKQLEVVDLQADARYVRTANQKKVSAAYNLLDELKKKLKGEHK